VGGVEIGLSPNGHEKGRSGTWRYRAA
jgi:hypothetical protein